MKLVPEKRLEATKVDSKSKSFFGERETTPFSGLPSRKRRRKLSVKQELSLEPKKLEGGLVICRNSTLKIMCGFEWKHNMTKNCNEDTPATTIGVRWIHGVLEAKPR